MANGQMVKSIFAGIVAAFVPLISTLLLIKQFGLERLPESIPLALVSIPFWLLTLSGVDAKGIRSENSTRGTWVKRILVMMACQFIGYGVVILLTSRFGSASSFLIEFLFGIAAVIPAVGIPFLTTESPKNSRTEITPEKTRRYAYVTVGVSLLNLVVFNGFYRLFSSI